MMRQLSMATTWLGVLAVAQAADGADRSYFDWLAGHPATVHAVYYDSQAKIDADSQASGPNSDVVYDAAENAARFTIATDKASLANQVRPGFATIDSGNVLYTWDARWGSGFLETGTMHTQKAFQLARTGSGEKRLVEVRTRFTQGSPQQVAGTDIRVYGTSPVDNDPLAPQASTFFIEPETWTRYWALVDIDSQNVSLWMADEDREAVLVYDAVPITLTGGFEFEQFWFEYNSSQSRTGPALTGWFTSLVVLHNVSDVGSVLSRPIPEPGSLALLGLGGVSLWRRRRKA